MKLVHPSQFARVFRQGRRKSIGGLLVISLANEVGHARLGLAIAKKHLKLASQRNRIKRLIRESFRLHHAALPAVDLVVVSLAPLREISAPALRHALEQHWQKVHSQWQTS